MPRLRSTSGMTVKELKEELANFSDDTQIFFTYQYGDHWHTQVAAAVNTVETANIKWSDYHSMHKIVDADEDAEDSKEVLIIS